VGSLAGIVLIVLLLGFTAELYRPASSALIADLVEPDVRVAAFSAYRLCVNLGWAFGLALGGVLAERSYDWLFVGDALASLVFAAVALGALPHGTRTSKREERERGHASAGSSMAADKGFLLFLGAVFITAMIFMQSASTFALHVTDNLHYSAKVYGFLQAGNGVLVVLFELPISAWTQRHERTRMVALGSIMVGGGFATLAFVGALPGLMLMIVISTMGEIVESPATSTFIADRAPEHARGRYQGALGMMFASAAVVGPLVGTSVFHVSPTALWLGCGAAGVVAAVLAIQAGHRPAPVRAATG
jgi:predicted MFS family arabinose efflux permease